MKKFLFILFGVFVVIGAFAAGENIPTSKSYVDSKLGEKQDTIPANDGVTQVLTNTGTAGEYGPKGIYDANGEYAAQTQNLVDAATMNAGVQNAIDSEFQCIEYDENNECLLMQIGNQNLFRPDLVTNQRNLINNGDGSFTCTGGSDSSIVSTGKKLSELAPNLIVGREYIFTAQNARMLQIKVSGGEYDVGNQTIGFYVRWMKDTKRTLTQEMLDGIVQFHAPLNGTVVISNVDIRPVPIYLPNGE